MMEMIAVIYVYGHKKFTNDIFEMTGVKPGIYWQITWRYLAPAIMLVILTSSIVSMSINHPTYQAWNKEEVGARIVNKVVLENNFQPHNIVIATETLFYSRGMLSLPHIPHGYSE